MWISATIICLVASGNLKCADCGYAGPPVADIAGNPVAVAAQDVCGKQLSDCKLRFGATAVLPYGGFPGCGLVS